MCECGRESVQHNILVIRKSPIRRQTTTTTSHYFISIQLNIRIRLFENLSRLTRGPFGRDGGYGPRTS